MIDTIAINLSAADFNIVDHTRFNPASTHLFEPPFMEFGSRRMLKCVNNPTKEQIRKHGYLPRLTLTKAVRKGGFAIFLRVEFSIPKLLFNNNFNEVQTQDFQLIVYRLRTCLAAMGVEVSDVQIIRDAEVAAIHYSKNIVLTDFTDPFHYISKIARSNVNLLYDTNQTDFRNEGSAWRYRSSSYEVIFYDKIKDLRKGKLSDKRSIEKDNFIQLSLLDKVELRRPFEVLRIEIRIGNRTRLKSELKKHNIEIAGLNFKSLFDSGIARIILLRLIDDIEESYPALLHDEIDSYEKLAVELQMQNPKIKLPKLLALLGATVLAKEVGLRRFRAIIARYGNDAWYRTKKDMKGYYAAKERNILGPIRKVVEEFEPIKIDLGDDFYA